MDLIEIKRPQRRGLIVNEEMAEGLDGKTEVVLMRLFHYRCPITGMNVQGRVEVDEGDLGESFYKQVRCSSCGRVHLINPNTGRISTDTDEFKRR